VPPDLNPALTKKLTQHRDAVRRALTTKMPAPITLEPRLENLGLEQIDRAYRARLALAIAA
jgi:hypothetical protein